MNTQTTMPAGRYYVGDLCYVLRYEWDEACQLMFGEGSDGNGVFTLADGRSFALFGTAYGDGVYPCSNGAEIPVDSGSVGCVLVTAISDASLREEKHLREHGTVVDFGAPFTCGSSGGVIRFGGVKVDTAAEDDSDADEYDDE